MSDYNQNDIWNKYVLSSRLKESTDGALLTPCPEKKESTVFYV